MEREGRFLHRPRDRGSTTPPPCRAKRGAAWPWSGKSLGRKGIPVAATVPLGFNQPPPCWLRAFSSRGEGRDWGGGVPSRSRGVDARSHLVQIAPSSNNPSQIPQSMGPDPQSPSPSSRGLAEAARDPLAAARFLPKKARMQLHAPREHLDPIPGMNGSWPRPAPQ